MMQTPTTKVAMRFQERLAEYLKKNTPRASHALVIEEKPVAKVLKDNPRKKKRSAAQIAAFKKMRAALKHKYGTSNIGKISKMKKRRGRRQELAANPKQLSENRGRRYEENQENEMAALSENPRRKKSRKKAKKGRKKARRRNRQARSLAQALSMTGSRPKRRRRRKAKSAGKRRAKRRTKASRRRRSTPRRRARTRVAKTHIVNLPASKRAQVQVVEITRRRRGKKRSGGRKRMMMENPGLFSGSGPPVLFQNPDGAFSMASIRAYGVAALGVGLGITVADIADRLVATRTPKDGKNPYYGKDAAAAYRSRPDAWRLATQLGGAAAGMGATYLARGRGLLPWVLGGIAVGFGANGFKMLWDWYAAPALFKVELADSGKPTMGNRLYPMEQNYIQDQVAKLFATRPFVTSLAPGQNDPPQITSPLGGGGTGATSMYQLGRPQQQLQASGVGHAGQQPRTFVNTGRLGNCTECGGFNGCFSNCETLCPDCPKYNRNTECRHQVMAGESLEAIAAAGGVSVEQISAMNGGGDPSTYWVAGNVVTLPYGACLQIENSAGVPVTSNLPPPGYSNVTPIPVTVPSTTVVETFQDTGPLVPQSNMPSGMAVAGPRGNGNGMDERTRKSLELSGANRQ